MESLRAKSTTLRKRNSLLGLTGSNDIDAGTTAPTTLTKPTVFLLVAHAEPTFVQSKNDQASPSLSVVLKTRMERERVLVGFNAGDNKNLGRTLKHFRSESDLRILQDLEKARTKNDKKERVLVAKGGMEKLDCFDVTATELESFSQENSENASSRITIAVSEIDSSSLRGDDKNKSKESG